MRWTRDKSDKIEETLGSSSDKSNVNFLVKCQCLRAVNNVLVLLRCIII